MTDAECKAIEQESVEKVRKALKTLTSGEIYDGKMSKFLNQAGYDALEEIEGLDLFWICDPLITLAKEKPKGDCENCNYRKFSETCVDAVVEVMNEYGITSVEELMQRLRGGAE